MVQAFENLLSIFVNHASDDAFDLVPGHSYFLEKDDVRAVRRLRVTLAPLLCGLEPSDGRSPLRRVRAQGPEEQSAIDRIVANLQLGEAVELLIGR